MELKGRAAIITGASRGCGRSTALSLAAQGCAVLINFNRSKEEAEAVATEARALVVKAITFQADTADDAACRAMVAAAVEAFGRLDILVNNAATTKFIPHDDLEAISDEVFDRIFAVNVKGPFQCIRAAREALVESRGEVVNISSVAGLDGRGSTIPYAASKAALICMTQTFARLLGPEVRVNSVAPGFIVSQWTEDGLKEKFEAVRDAHIEKSALHQVLGPDDVAEAVLSLLEGSDLITGQTLVVDGGAMIGQ